MPRPPVIATWPEAIRVALNERLRATAYASLKQSKEWLAKQGYDTSKSALHIYSIRLRQVDADNGIEAACLLLKSSMFRKAARTSSRRTRLAAAAAQLGEAATQIEAIAPGVGVPDSGTLLQASQHLRAAHQLLESVLGNAG